MRGLVGPRKKGKGSFTNWERRWRRIYLLLLIALCCKVKNRGEMLASRTVAPQKNMFRTQFLRLFFKDNFSLVEQDAA